MLQGNWEALKEGIIFWPRAFQGRSLTTSRPWGWGPPHWYGGQAYAWWGQQPVLVTQSTLGKQHGIMGPQQGVRLHQGMIGPHQGMMGPQLGMMGQQKGMSGP